MPDHGDSDDDEKLRARKLVEQVKQIIRNDPANWASNLEKIGFEWFDDNYGDQEVIEEQQATPQNLNQEYLCAYFEGNIPLSQEVLTSFEIERNSEDPNYPLIRKYFKQANPYLKKLILSGLDLNPTHQPLLCDLSFFHEFSPLLTELIERYVQACLREQDMLQFSELVKDFYYHTHPDGYDAVHALKEIFLPDSAKGQLVCEFEIELNHQPESIEF
ncbi:MAG: hypothetical protein HQM12_02480 [SAR324 cluster bacterium]|nr:hypothetical protein [SAR324 cluster bacterium]